MEITNRDRLRWQLIALSALTDLTEDAHRADLPVLDWSVTGGLRLLGEPGPASDAAKVGAVRAWAGHLGAPVQVRDKGDRTTYLAKAEVRAPNGSQVTVSLMTHTAH